MSDVKYQVKFTAQFRKDYRMAIRRGLDITLLDDVIAALAKGEFLAAKHKDHALKGKWKGRRECHVMPNWLLIYQKVNDTLVLDLFRTGTHQDIFANE